MSAHSSIPRPARRLVLVDFDWEDADLVPRLLRAPGVSVRRVAGVDALEAGVWIADLCGLPRTLDLADLTREIFDLALVSPRSPRRAQVASLLSALGTPVLAPEEYLSDGSAGPAPASVGTLSAEPVATEVRPPDAVRESDPFACLVDPAESGDRSGPPVWGQRTVSAGSELTPGPEDRAGLEAWLARRGSETSAVGALLRIVPPTGEETRVESGFADPLLIALAGAAAESELARVVVGAAGPDAGVAWGAWPFRAGRHRAVLAAAGMRAEAFPRWEAAAAALKGEWERREREQAAAAFPMVPQTPAGWVDPVAFEARLELAVERHARDGLRFALHQLDLPISAIAADHFVDRLPHQLRGTDSICRPAPRRVLLLTVTPLERFPSLRGRLAALWQQSWLAAGHERPIPGLTDLRCEMARPADAPAFLEQGKRWLEDGAS